MNKETSKSEFRFHKPTLEESLETLIEVDNKENLCEIINKKLKLNNQVNVDDIEIEYYTFDERIKWETYIVKLKNYGIIGFLNKQLI